MNLAIRRLSGFTTSATLGHDVRPSASRPRSSRSPGAQHGRGHQGRVHTSRHLARWAKCLLTCLPAEDRGFEPRKGVNPNRISSAPLRVPGSSGHVRDCAGTQVTTAVTCRAVPGLTGTAWPFCACLVRAQCVRADRPVRQAER
jgi:hypothetical protein